MDPKTILLDLLDALDIMEERSGHHGDVEKRLAAIRVNVGALPGPEPEPAPKAS